MTTSEENRIGMLLRKQLQHTSTDADRKELARCTNTLSDEEVGQCLAKVWGEHSSSKEMPEDTSDRIFRGIVSTKVCPRKSRRMNIVRYASVAASIMILLLAGIYGYQRYLRTHTYTVIAKAVEIPASTSVSFSRHLILPDGSTVILKHGSKLHSQTFTRAVREVTLMGEAYFDVVKNKKTPFVVHAGHVTTSVLGTAFNVKSDHHGVVVSVARGKVRVAQGGKVLAVLGENDEINCQNDEKAVPQPVASTKNETKWLKEDMQFLHTPMKDVARTISRRYGVNVAVNTPELENLIFVSNFSGTESLDEVLTVLCAVVPDMSYKIEGNNAILYKVTNKNNNRNT